MTDDIKTMLALAAKAMGIPLLFAGPDNTTPVRGDFVWVPWNPIASGGDNSDMEAALQLDIKWDDDLVKVRVYGATWIEESYADHGGDRKAARRLASTRAAAEIGRNMK